ncbi:MAG: translation initiation factor IF-2 [bacterium]
MAKQRISQYAKEWGVKSKAVIERLEKMGVKGKRAQSGIEDSEAERVRHEMGLDAQDVADVTGETTEQVVEVKEDGGGGRVTALDTVTRKRLRGGSLLRRTRRKRLAEGDAEAAAPAFSVASNARAVTASLDTDAGALAVAFASGPFAEAHSSLSVVPSLEQEPEVVAPIGLPLLDSETTPESSEDGPGLAATAEFDIEDDGGLVSKDLSDDGTAAETGSETAAVEAEEHAGRAKQEVSDDDREAIAEELLKAAESKDKPAEESPEDSKRKSSISGPRILGRIDLSALKKPKVAPVSEKETTTDKPADADGKTRKRKRRVVKKEELFDAFERSYQARPRKKRAMPGQKLQKTELTIPKAAKRVVRIHDVISPAELAKAIGVKSGEVLGKLMGQGVMTSLNDSLDFDTVSLIAEEFGYTVENTSLDVAQLLEHDSAEEGSEEEGLARPPVVTVMGHVDHGKTSLLDVIRDSRVVEGEAGGITQHIGAYTVGSGAQAICFLDTPGHAAFTSMRARGASVTDIVVLVVAADDGVMPQTIEAVNHAKAAGIPVVVAVNKMDKPDANPDRVKQQLSDHGLQPEDWGGDTLFVPVSAIKRTGIDDLLGVLRLQAEILELKAIPDGRARGVVIEARLDKGRGPVATVLVQRGVLKHGDNFVSGDVTGRVRAMTDYAGVKSKSAGPSTPVEIIGLDGVPEAGDSFAVVDDSSRADQVAEHRKDVARKAQLASSTRLSLEDFQKHVASGEVAEFKVVVKADVKGSAEALSAALEQIGTDEVTLSVIHNGVGAINESDVQLALASGAVVIGFHVRPEGKARTLAEREGVDLRLHEVIYEALDEVKLAMEGLLAPDVKEISQGRAEVRDTFGVPGGTTIAGSYINEGKVKRGAHCRLVRDGVVTYNGTISSLRRFKEDVREVQSSYECGIGLDKFNDIKVGDVVETFELEEVRRTLESPYAGKPAGSAGA